jgi:3',5'-cyclic AMP phosphodiesterase CpdA
MTIRLAHISDIHLTASPLNWRMRDRGSKKILGYLNIKLLGRGYRFRYAPQVVQALMTSIRSWQPDCTIFTGDATTLSFPAEFAQAVERLRPAEHPGIAVPGNHDYYTRFDAASGRFEQAFSPWLEGVRVDEHLYPFARKVGHAWLIAVNSSNPKWWNYGASARIGKEQRDRLRTLCSRLDAGPRILVTHYPLRTARGKLEHRSRRLLDHQEALAVARDCGIQLWLHGHIHQGYILHPRGEIPFPMICAGSGTQTHRWMYCRYFLSGDHLDIEHWQYDLHREEFQVHTKDSLELARS